MGSSYSDTFKVRLQLLGPWPLTLSFIENFPFPIDRQVVWGTNFLDNLCAAVRLIFVRFRYDMTLLWQMVDRQRRTPCEKQHLNKRPQVIKYTAVSAPCLQRSGWLRVFGGVSSWSSTHDATDTGLDLVL